jgi:hypothetical protein
MLHARIPPNLARALQQPASDETGSLNFSRAASRARVRQAVANWPAAPAGQAAPAAEETVAKRRPGSITWWHPSEGLVDIRARSEPC